MSCDLRTKLDGRPDDLAYWIEHVEPLVMAAPPSDPKAFAPDPLDMVRLHRHVVETRAQVCIEFGTGWSTLAIGNAAMRNGGVLVSVDTDRSWLDISRARCDAAGVHNVAYWHAECQAVLHGLQLCHLYDRLPDIVPDFIYVDGPNPRRVHGTIRGLSWALIQGRSPIVADPLLYESSLGPHATIMVDGRLANVEFLLGNLQRPWHVEYLDGKAFDATSVLRQCHDGESDRSLT